MHINIIKIPSRVSFCLYKVNVGNVCNWHILKLVTHSRYSNCKSSKCKGPIREERSLSTSKKVWLQLNKFEAKKEESIFKIKKVLEKKGGEDLAILEGEISTHHMDMMGHVIHILHTFFILVSWNYLCLECVDDVSPSSLWSSNHNMDFHWRKRRQHHT